MCAIRYLYAKYSFEAKKFAEAEQALLQDVVIRVRALKKLSFARSSRPGAGLVLKVHFILTAHKVIVYPDVGCGCDASIAAA